MSQRATPPTRSTSEPRRTTTTRIGIGASHSRLSQRIAAPSSPAEADAQYVAARDAWTAAMRGAASGRPADMATLAIAQEAYEAASAERERWRSTNPVPIPVDGHPERASIEVVVDQALAWRDVHEHGRARGGLLGRLFGRGRRSPRS